MTIRREPLTTHHAVRSVADQIGWDGAARVTGRSERRVQKWSEPDAGVAISFEHALQLDLACIAAGGIVAPFEAMYRAHLELARAAARADLCHTAECAAEAAREAGEAIAAQFQAMRPGASPRDRREVLREIREAIHAFGHALVHFELWSAAA